MQATNYPKIAPPDRASSILNDLGYPVGATTLRRWYKAGQIPGCFTGKRVLLNIDKIIEYLETGDQVANEPLCTSNGIRRVEA